MNINKITITGADDTTSIKWMEGVTGHYPFVEWGILTSPKSKGAMRVPKIDWVKDLFNNDWVQRSNFSLHVCGQFVRDITWGVWDPFLKHHEEVLDNFGRIQLNFHGKHHNISDDMVESMRAFDNHQIIFQIDNINNKMFSTAWKEGLNVAPLFDLSHGNGIVPDVWPQSKNIYSGYAGGLGPDNIVEEIEKIKKVSAGYIWLDMETHVRQSDGYELDQKKVEKVLSLCSSYVWG